MAERRSPSVVVRLKLQPDGKIVAAGSRGPGPGDGETKCGWHAGYRLRRRRFDNDRLAGSDPMSAIAIHSRTARSLLRADRIAAAPLEQMDAFIRYNTDGSPDTSFGNNGKVEFPTFTPGFPIGSRIYIRPDGKILAIYNGPEFHRAIRLTAEGRPDPAFYADGVGTFRNNKFISNPTPWTNSGEFDGQGRIILIGSDYVPTTPFNDNMSLFIGRIEIQTTVTSTSTTTATERPILLCGGLRIIPGMFLPRINILQLSLARPAIGPYRRTMTATG